jgi:hypothetical protein
MANAKRTIGAAVRFGPPRSLSPASGEGVLDRAPVPARSDFQPTALRLALAGLVASGLLAPPGAARGDPRGRAAPAHEVLTGIVRSIRIGQLEPAETPQATFFLDIRRADGKAASVLVELPAPIFCFEGDLAVIEGDLAEDDVLPPILLSARILSCRASR